MTSLTAENFIDYTVDSKTLTTAESELIVTQLYADIFQEQFWDINRTMDDGSILFHYFEHHGVHGVLLYHDTDHGSQLCTKFSG